MGRGQVRNWPTINYSLNLYPIGEQVELTKGCRDHNRTKNLPKYPEKYFIKRALVGGLRWIEMPGNNIQYIASWPLPQSFHHYHYKFSLDKHSCCCRAEVGLKKSIHIQRWNDFQMDCSCIQSVKNTNVPFYSTSSISHYQ